MALFSVFISQFLESHSACHCHFHFHKCATTIDMAACHEKFRYACSLDGGCPQFQCNSETELCQTCHTSTSNHKLTVKKSSTSQTFLTLLTAFAATRNVRVSVSAGCAISSGGQEELVNSLAALQLLPVTATSCVSVELLEEASSLRRLFPFKAISQHGAVR